jgi:endonuclease/exonuclease/phosphatase family metal-dependent hydrolase
MEHSSSVLALAGALLLGVGGDSRLKGVTNSGFAERSAAATWSRPQQLVSSPQGVPQPAALHPTLSQPTEQMPGNSPAPEARGASDQFTPAHGSGRFSLLTYNVAGLPQLVSSSDPEVNVELISPLLNHYDIALVQEDFSYHSRLTAHASHMYRSEPMRQSLALVPDGLNWYSRYPFGWLHRVRWLQCNGYLDAASDCLADKGFSFSELTLASGVSVDVYNLHAEAGSSPLDIEVRRANFEQLAAYIRTRSRHRPIIVAGDTNLRASAPRDLETLEHFLEATGLRDACRRFGCAEERLDRVFFASSQQIELDVLGWWTDRRFVDVHGAPLSDHPAIGVELSWREVNHPELVAGR